jgi:hypothetical protein
MSTTSEMLASMRKTKEEGNLPENSTVKNNVLTALRESRESRGEEVEVEEKSKKKPATKGNRTGSDQASSMVNQPKYRTQTVKDKTKYNRKNKFKSGDY